MARRRDKGTHSVCGVDVVGGVREAAMMKMAHAFASTVWETQLTKMVM